MKKIVFIICLVVIIAAGIFTRCSYKSIALVDYIDAGAAVCIDTTGNVWEVPAAGLHDNDIITFYNFNMLTPSELHDDITITNTIKINNNIDFEY